jgi:hypothetical protein
VAVEDRAYHCAADDLADDRVHDLRVRLLAALRRFVVAVERVGVRVERLDP